MRSELTQTFIDECSRNGRQPVQFLVFHFASGDVTVSDAAFTSATSSVLKIVEDWGSISDAVDIASMVKGVGSPTRSATISLINSGISPFSAKFNDEAPENTDVSFYQTFNYQDTGIDIENAVLIDTFKIQDPISFTEASCLLSLDLVSSNQYSDPIVGTLDPVTNEYYGVVLGAISGVTGTAYNTHPLAVLTADITASQTTIECDVDLLTVGFVAPGNALIDYERVSYTGISGTSFTGCSRGYDAGTETSAAFPHSEGTTVTRRKYEYLFAFGEGPVITVGPVYADGELYSGDVNLYPDRNPVQIGFVGGYPFERVDGDIDIEVEGIAPSSYSVNLYYTEEYIEDFNAEILDCDSSALSAKTDGTFQSGAALPYIDYVFSAPSVFGVSVTGYSSITTGNTHANIWGCSFTGTNLSIVADGYVNGEIVVDGPDAGDGYIFTHGTYDETIESWNDFDSSDTVKLSVNKAGWNGTLPVTYIGGVDCLYKDITYSPYKKEFYATITCDVSSGTGNTNPSDAIQSMLSKIGVSSSIDEYSFTTTKAWFTLNGYNFNGFIPGESRTRETIKDMCKQSRSYLVYNNGKIYHYIKYHTDDQTEIAEFLPNDLRIKSVSVVRQNVADILNYTTIRYDAKATQEDYQESYIVQDTDSIDAFGLQDETLDFYLISDSTMAIDVAEFWLEESRVPSTVITFNTYLDAFPFEVGDVVLLKSMFNKFFAFKGDIANIVRYFGSGKNKSINYFAITIKANSYSLVEKEVSEGLLISDATQIATLVECGTDTLSMSEIISFVKTIETGYGNNGYGSIKYGD